MLPIKEAARFKAHAKGIAQVQAAREESHAKLQIANPSSSIFSSTATLSHTHSSDLQKLNASLPKDDATPVGTVIIHKGSAHYSCIDGLPKDGGKSNTPLTSPQPEPSLETLEKGAAISIYFEQLYHGILKRPRGRDVRRLQLQEALETLTEEEQARAKAAWLAAETEYLRDLRTRVDVGSFTKLKCIGHGAFGVVNLVQERQTGGLYAMKQLRKADMLRKGQEGHVRAERDFMSEAASATRHIVRLAYSFQDVDHLYLVME